MRSAVTRAVFLLVAACGEKTTAPPPAAEIAPRPADARPASDANVADVIRQDAASHDGARVCIANMRAEYERRKVSFHAITATKNVRLRLAVFGAVCANEFPAWAAAATAASTQGSVGRRRVFAELVKDRCPEAATAASGADVIAACPQFVGSLWEGAAPLFLRQIDAGTFTFCTLLLQEGFDTFADELALQASFHRD